MAIFLGRLLNVGYSGASNHSSVNSPLSIRLTVATQNPSNSRFPGTWWGFRLAGRYRDGVRRAGWFAIGQGQGGGGRRRSGSSGHNRNQHPLPALLVYGTPTSPELIQASWFRAEETQAAKASAVGRTEQ
jgi:hypothetical protein